MRILELTLLTHDVRAMRTFYGARLGLPVVGATATSISLRAGDTRLTFESAGPGTRPFYHFAFNVSASRFDEAVEWIGERASLLTRGSDRTFDFPSWNAHSVYFEDPAGNVAELIARRALPETDRDRTAGFGPGAILSVSEIGLPVRAVEETSRFLSAATGVPLWSRSGGGFAALGDDRGLFIVVTRARDWYPTHRAAGVFPVVLTVDGPRERRVRVPGTPYLVVTRPA